MSCTRRSIPRNKSTTRTALGQRVEIRSFEALGDSSHCHVGFRYCYKAILLLQITYRQHHSRLVICGWHTSCKHRVRKPFRLKKLPLLHTQMSACTSIARDCWNRKRPSNFLSQLALSLYVLYLNYNCSLYCNQDSNTHASATAGVVVMYG